MNIALLLTSPHLKVKCYTCNKTFNKLKGLWAVDENKAEHLICPKCYAIYNKIYEQEEEK